MDISYLQFLAGAMVISLTGVMAPGPLAAVTVGKGSGSPHAGVLIAVGHAIVEFPLMAAIFFGFGYIFSIPYVKPAIGIAGGAFLLFMAAGMFRSLRDGGVDAAADRRSPVAAGAVLSIANPYFLIWWATVGAAMVMQAAGFGVAGLVIFMVAHWLCDLGWSWFLSALSYRGGRFFGNNFQKAVFAVSGVALVGFGGKFLFDAVKSLL
ncbi:MAG: LysE family transporter [Spirochaetes bacterium]|nr:LysE family transporter [Spirochaetota bacterium]